MTIAKLPEVPYPGMVPWEVVRKKINEIVDSLGGTVSWNDITDKPTIPATALSGEGTPTNATPADYIGQLYVDTTYDQLWVAISLGTGEGPVWRSVTITSNP